MLHQSIWKEGKPSLRSRLRRPFTRLPYYIAFIIKHAKALNAFTNSADQFVQRLIPGFEAPVLLAFRHAPLRFHSNSVRPRSQKAKRIEVRFPRSRPQFRTLLMRELMAGLMGSENKFIPAKRWDRIYCCHRASLRTARNLGC